MATTMMRLHLKRLQRYKHSAQLPPLHLPAHADSLWREMDYIMALADIISHSFFAGESNMAPNPNKAPLNKLFDSYREDPKNEPDEVNMEGMMSLVGKLELSLEDVDLLIFSELVQSPTLGTITRAGFVDGLAKEK